MSRPPDRGVDRCRVPRYYNAEMANVNARPVRIYAGMPVGQLVFSAKERAGMPLDKRGDAKYLDGETGNAHPVSREPEIRD